MAHTFGASTVIAATTANPATVAITLGSTVTVLVVCINSIGNTARAGGAPTYNGLSLVQAGTTQLVAAGTNRPSTEIWYLLAPPTGSSFTLSVPNTGANSIVVVAASFISATGASALDQVNGTIGNSTNPTLNTTTLLSGEAVIAITGTNGGALTAPTNTNISAGVNTANDWYGSQYALQANAGSITTGWTAASGRWALSVATFSEVTKSNNQLMMMGSGR